MLLRETALKDNQFHPYRSRTLGAVSWRRTDQWTWRN